MQILKPFLLVLLPFLLLAADGTPSVVIVNKSNQIAHLSASKVRILFLRNISRWPWGAEIVPVDLPDTAPARRDFLKRFMGSTPSQMDVYWIDQKISRSLDPPMRVSTPKEAKTWVAAHPGAIAYIPAADVDDTVRVIEAQ